MSTNSVVLLILSIVMSIGGVFLLNYEWNRLENEEGKNSKIPKWMIFYSLCMLAVNALIIYLMQTIYVEQTLCGVAKRLVLLVVLWIAAATDKKYNIIPNDLILVGAAGRVIILIAEIVLERENLIPILLSEGIALVGAIIIVALCLLVMKNSIGMGDVKLLMVMTIMQGTSGIVISVFMSLLVSFIVAVILLLRKVKSRKDTLPFAPCMLVGTMLGVILTGM